MTNEGISFEEVHEMTALLPVDEDGYLNYELFVDSAFGIETEWCCPIISFDF